jgi:hypothetical protein
MVMVLTAAGGVSAAVMSCTVETFDKQGVYDMSQVERSVGDKIEFDTSEKNWKTTSGQFKFSASDPSEPPVQILINRKNGEFFSFEQWAGDARAGLAGFIRSTGHCVDKTTPAGE